jgi:hypothetical protein
MRHAQSAFALVAAVTAVTAVTAVALPLTAHAETPPSTWATHAPEPVAAQPPVAPPAATAEGQSGAQPSSPTAGQTSERFEVPPPHEVTTDVAEPAPPHKDPMTLPVVMEHPEDKPSIFSNEKTRFGLMGGIGFPRPVGVGAFLQFDKHYSVGADYSLLPTTKISDVNLDFWAASAGGRLYPFQGAFFVGLKGGYQHLSASGYLTTSGTTALAQGSIDTVFINPELGFLFTWDSGLALSFGAGLQIPLYSDASTTANVPVSASVLDAVGKIGTGAIPTVDLLRVGFVL